VDGLAAQHLGSLALELVRRDEASLAEPRGLRAAGGSMVIAIHARTASSSSATTEPSSSRTSTITSMIRIVACSTSDISAGTTGLMASRSGTVNMTYATRSVPITSCGFEGSRKSAMGVVTDRVLRIGTSNAAPDLGDPAPPQMGRRSAVRPSTLVPVSSGSDAVASRDHGDDIVGSLASRGRRGAGVLQLRH
jgi:hypothetical protein